MDQSEIDRWIEYLGSCDDAVEKLEKLGEPALRRLFEVTEGLVSIPLGGYWQDASTNRALALGCLGKRFPEVFLELVKSRPFPKIQTIQALGFTGDERLEAFAKEALKDFGNDWAQTTRSRIKSHQAYPHVVKTSNQPVSCLWRRYLRFSVRGLIVLVLVIGAGLGWVVRSARMQREAVAAIKDAGGIAFYNWEWRDGNPVVGGKPWAPKWLVERIGVDYFGHVTCVQLISLSKPTDTTLTHVARLTELEVLIIGPSTLGDDELAHLKSLTKLLSLAVIGTQVTDAGLAHLKGLTNLSFVYLGGTQVTDAGTRGLKQALPGLWIVH